MTSLALCSCLLICPFTHTRMHACSKCVQRAHLSRALTKRERSGTEWRNRKCSRGANKPMTYIQWGENGMRKFEENRKTSQKDRARWIENDQEVSSVLESTWVVTKKKIKNSISHLKEAGLYSLRFHWHALCRCKVSCKTFIAVWWLAHSCNRAECAWIDYSLRDFCLKLRMILTFLNGFYIKIKGAVLHKRKPTGWKWRQMIL